MKPITMAIFVILLVQNGTNLMTMMLMMWRKMIRCKCEGQGIYVELHLLWIRGVQSLLPGG